MTQDASRIPFLKWAGGKRWLTQSGVPMPCKFSRLVEPFAGSAAVFFNIQPASAILADTNEDLINLYCMMRDRPEDLYREVAVHHRNHCKDYYYSIRSSTLTDNVMRAARMLYLNRTCWNGLYRVNKFGDFNVPIGTKSNVLWESDNFAAYSKALQSAKIHCQDFSKTISTCGDGDFIFVDPPYTVKHNMNGFVKYNEKIFSWDDQVRLVDSLKRAAARGSSIVVTNADHESVLELYSDSFEYKALNRHSVLAGSAPHRGKTTEALFTINMN